jgi:hypothetical protein
MWRPERPRIILLAESHVWTSPHEAKCEVRHPDGVTTGFARFIYCLGAGEPTLVTPAVYPNVSGSQYWKLLHDTVRGPGQSHAGLTKTGEPKAVQRIANKLALLQAMRTAGIWLVDASVSALYRAGHRLAAGETYNKLLLDCWHHYVAEIIAASAPSLIIVIGKLVEDAIGEAVRHDLGAGVEIRVIKQPNAHMTSSQFVQYRQQVFDLCEKHQGGTG